MCLNFENALKINRIYRFLEALKGNKVYQYEKYLKSLLHHLCVYKENMSVFSHIIRTISYISKMRKSRKTWKRVFENLLRCT